MSSTLIWKNCTFREQADPVPPSVWRWHFSRLCVEPSKDLTSGQKIRITATWQLNTLDNNGQKLLSFDYYVAWKTTSSSIWTPVQKYNMDSLQALDLTITTPFSGVNSGDILIGFGNAGSAVSHYAAIGVNTQLGGLAAPSLPAGSETSSTSTIPVSSGTTGTTLPGLPTSLNPVTNAFTDVIGAITQGLLSLINGLKAVIDFLLSSAKALISGAVDWLDSQLRQFGNADPDKVKERLAIMLGAAFAIAVGLFVISLSMDSIPFIHGSTMLEIGTFVQRLYGLDAMVGAFSGAMIGASLGTPLQQYANEVFRPREISDGLALQMYFKNEISKDQFYQIMARNGYADWRTDLILDDAKGDLEFGTLQRLADIIDLPDDYITKVLKNARWRDKELQYLFQAVKFKPVKDELLRFKSDALGMYKAGLVSDSQLDTYLDYIGAKPAERTAIFNNARIEFERTLIAEKINIIKLAYSKGFIDEVELRDFLRALNIREEIVNLVWVEMQIRNGINPAELLSFPQISRFIPTPLPFTTIITTV